MVVVPPLSASSQSGIEVIYSREYFLVVEGEKKREKKER
jgi:hypothetical protein